MTSSTTASTNSRSSASSKARSLASERLYLNLVTALGSSPTYSRLPLDEATKLRSASGRSSASFWRADDDRPVAPSVRMSIQIPIGTSAPRMGYDFVVVSEVGLSQVSRFARRPSAFWLYV